MIIYFFKIKYAKQNLYLCLVVTLCKNLIKYSKIVVLRLPIKPYKLMKNVLGNPKDEIGNFDQSEKYGINCDMCNKNTLR